MLRVGVKLPDPSFGQRPLLVVHGSPALLERRSNRRGLAIVWPQRLLVRRRLRARHVAPSRRRPRGESLGIGRPNSKQACSARAQRLLGSQQLRGSSESETSSTRRELKLEQPRGARARHRQRHRESLALERVQKALCTIWDAAHAGQTD